MLYYRGQSKRFTPNPATGNDLTPSLFRGRQELSLVREAEYYRKLFKYLKDALDLGKAPDHLALGKLQHYSVPTRLLDITSSREVALYFACNDHFDEDGYVYQFDGNEFYDLKSEAAKAVTRKITTLMRADEFLKNRTDLQGFFQKEEKVKRINPASISKAVILNYALIFKEESIKNIRYERQNGSFILFGNKTEEKDGSLFLVDGVNFEALKNLQAERIKAGNKLSELERLATEEGLHFVYFFPDESASLRLVSKYHEMFSLADEKAGSEALKDFIRESFPTDEGETSEYSAFKYHLLENATKIQTAASRNPNVFYFLFQELRSFFIFSRNRKRALLGAREVMNKILMAA